MRARRFFLLAFLVGGALLVAALDAASHSDGAPPGSGQQGCTCHSMQPSSQASVTLSGLPATAHPGAAYELMVTVVGPIPSGALNSGGFALEVDPAVGAFAFDDAVHYEEGTLTHTEAGNDQRVWTFTWTAPTNGTNVTFFFAGNAVNGDGVSDPLDFWNRDSVVVPMHNVPPTNNTTTPPPESKTDSPGPSSLLVLGAAAIAVVAWRFRGRGS